MAKKNWVKEMYFLHPPGTQLHPGLPFHSSPALTRLPAVLHIYILRKGIDIVRRDWSEISKLVGHYILDLILDMKTDKDNLSALIYEYLKKLSFIYFFMI